MILALVKMLGLQQLLSKKIFFVPTISAAFLLLWYESYDAFVCYVISLFFM